MLLNNVKPGSLSTDDCFKKNGNDVYEIIDAFRYKKITIDFCLQAVISSSCFLISKNVI